MNAKFVWGGVCLMLIAAAVGAAGFYDVPNPGRLDGVINDFSPRSTAPNGPYLVNGPWSIQFRPTGTADLTASLTMVRSDLWFVETAGDAESQAARNFHSHHLRMTNVPVTFANNTVTLSGPVTITGNGSQVFPGSTLGVVITGGSTFGLSNIKLTFGGPAAGHFTTQPYDGVVRQP
jgi:hypothetical protein